MNNLDQVIARNLYHLNNLLQLQIEVSIASINDRVDCSEFAHRLDTIQEERNSDERDFPVGYTVDKETGRFIPSYGG